MARSLDLAVPTTGVLDTPVVCIQINEQWLDALITATERLEFARTWTEGADMDVIRGEITKLVDYLVDVRDCAVNQPPYWDEQDASDIDVDEDVPIGSFPWYENVADFFVAAFLAASFTPEAAIQVVTTARKFRLAFRSRDYGAILRVFVDGVLQTNVDTYSATPGIVSANIIPTGEPPHTLRIEHSGTHNASAIPTAQGYGMEVIRKRLSEAELDAIIDVRTVGGQVQLMRDDGLGWVSVVDAEYVRRDGSLSPDMTGTLTVKPITNVPAAIFQRALTAATSDILQLQTEAGVRLIGFSAAGRLTSSGMEIQVNPTDIQLNIIGVSPAVVTIDNNAVQLQRALAMRNGAWSIQSILSAQYRFQTNFRSFWDNAVVATRRSGWSIDTYAVAVAVENIRAGNNGTLPTLGVLGSAGTIRQTLTGDFAGNVAAKALATALANFGWITDSTTLGSATDVSDTLCRIANGLIFELKNGVSSIIGRMRDGLLASESSEDIGNGAKAIYTEYYGSRVWWANPSGAQDEYFESAIVTYSTATAMEFLDQLDYMLSSAFDGVWESAFFATIPNVSMENDDILAWMTALPSYYPAHLRPFVDFFEYVITETAIAGIRTIANSAMLGAPADSCIPTIAEAVDDCTQAARTDNGGYITHTGQEPASGAWSSGSSGWVSTFHAPSGLYKIGLQQTCFMLPSATLSYTFTTSVNSVVGCQVRRVDGSLTWASGQANSGVVTDGTWTVPLPPGDWSGEIYIEPYASTVGTVVFHEARIY